ncbi:MAG: asparagine synthase (glutamine-hydrolyzing) [Rhodobacteraceae bacterium]|nr:asparagine synthase (glutamine-hydrolyzing) [Paracoccaceae bacterium]
MCGIVGGVGQISQEQIDEMLLSISHRGPDFLATSEGDGVRLGHARLSIIDLSSASNQPLWDPHRRACIVFNGEIYNYKKLRALLVERGCQFRSAGDAEVLLNAYLEYGPEGLSMAEGMFSFAIWLAEREELILARDPFGVKPLYYCENEFGFYFASEIKALATLDCVSSDLDIAAIYRTLIYMWSPGESTLLAAVKKVSPGTYIKVKNRKIIDIQKFWRWDHYKPSQKTFAQCASAVDNALNAAIESQLVSDVPVGAFLSGGLDSSLLAALIQTRSSSPLHCFTIAVDNSDSDAAMDLSFARRLSELLGFELSEVDASPKMASRLLETMYYLDEVNADPAAIMVRDICASARKEGIKVLISGAGGDDLFTGYRRHFAVRFESIFRIMPAPLSRLVLWSVSGLPTKLPLVRRIKKVLSYIDVSGEQRVLSYFYWADPEAIRELFLPVYSDRLKDEVAAPFVDALSRTADLPEIERMLCIEREFFLVDHNFNYVDKMSMAEGIEVRVPYLDFGVVQQATAIHQKLKQRFLVGKAVLKKAAEKYLPSDLIYRKKVGFGVPLRDWILGDLSALVATVLSPGQVENRGLFNADAVSSMIEENKEGIHDYSYTIFALLCVELWCQVFVDGVVVEQNYKSERAIARL